MHVSMDAAKSWGVLPPSLPPVLSSFLSLSLPSLISLIPSFPFFDDPTRKGWGALWASQTPNGFSMHSEITNRPMVSGDGGVEEVYRRWTSITSHKVDQKFGGVGQPQPKCLGVPTPTIPAVHDCITARQWLTSFIENSALEVPLLAFLKISA